MKAPIPMAVLVAPHSPFKDCTDALLDALWHNLREYTALSRVVLEATIRVACAYVTPMAPIGAFTAFASELAQELSPYIDPKTRLYNADAIRIAINEELFQRRFAT